MPDHGQSFGNVPIGRELGIEYVPDNARFVDDVCYPAGHDPQCFGHTIGRCASPVGVGQKQERQPMAAGKCLVALRRVGTNADDHRPGLHEILVGVAKTARLFGADRSAVFRIKEKHDRIVAAKLRQRNALARIARAD